MRLAANGAQRKRPHPEKGQGHVFGRSGNAESRATPGRERGGWAMSCVCVCVCVCVARSGPERACVQGRFRQPRSLLTRNPAHRQRMTAEGRRMVKRNTRHGRHPMITGKKVFMSVYVSFWEKKQIISASHPFGVIPGCR